MLDARDHAARDAECVAALGEAQHRHFLLQRGDLAQFQGRHPFEEAGSVHGEQRQVGAVGDPEDVGSVPPAMKAERLLRPATNTDRGLAMTVVGFYPRSRT